MVSTKRIGQMHRADGFLMEKKILRQLIYVDIMVSRIHCGFNFPNWFCPDVPDVASRICTHYQSEQQTKCPSSHTV